MIHYDTGVQAGRYYVGMVIDPDQLIDEVDDTFNDNSGYCGSGTSGARAITFSCNTSNGSVDCNEAINLSDNVTTNGVFYNREGSYNCGSNSSNRYHGFYKITATQSGTASIDFSENAFGNYEVFIFDGCPLNSCLGSYDSVGDSWPNNFQVIAGRTYYFIFNESVAGAGPLNDFAITVDIPNSSGLPSCPANAEISCLSWVEDRIIEKNQQLCQGFCIGSANFEVYVHNYLNEKVVEVRETCGDTERLFYDCAGTFLESCTSFSMIGNEDCNQSALVNGLSNQQTIFQCGDPLPDCAGGPSINCGNLPELTCGNGIFSTNSAGGSNINSICTVDAVSYTHLTLPTICSV